VPLPRKFMNFSSQNGVIWCILGVLFLRFACPMDCSCMIWEKIKHLSKYWRVVNTGRPRQVKYWGGVATPATRAALTPMRNSSVDTVKRLVYYCNGHVRASASRLVGSSAEPLDIRESRGYTGETCGNTADMRWPAVQNIAVWLAY